MLVWCYFEYANLKILPKNRPTHPLKWAYVSRLQLPPPLRVTQGLLSITLPAASCEKCYMGKMT